MKVRDNHPLATPDRLLRFCIAVQVNGYGIDAIAQARGGGSVVEDVTQVGVAAGAGDFDAAHAKAQVFVLVDTVGVNGVKKAGPSAVGVEFLV